MEGNDEVAHLATRQHGVVARRQLREIGLGDSGIDHWLARGRLHSLFQGVYAVGHRNITQHGWWMAAVLTAGEDAVLSHRSAAGLWLLRPVPNGTIEVTTPRRLRKRRGLRCHAAELPEDEITRRDGIPVTSVARTVLDLAATTDRHNAEHAMRQWDYQRYRSRPDLADLLHRYPRRRGTATIRAILDARTTGISRSALEERFLEFVDRTGLPRPELNARIEANGRWFEVDCVWREQRVALELDGRQAHATQHAFQNDRARDRALTVAGWRPVRVTDLQLRTEATGLERDLRALLAP